MATQVLQPTASQTPDAVLGGDAVTGITNTGHASTSASGADGSSQTKSARWHTFQTLSAQIIAITLKITHTSNGALTGVADNTFRLQYTLNGGSSWTTAVERLSFTGSQGPTTFSVGLPATQDISQVQVRDLLDANTADVGDSASATATISDIQVEVTTLDSGVIVIM